MDQLRFDWDEQKARENQRKHGVSFDEARSVFFDPQAVEFFDDEHEQSEERFLLLGVSAKLRILMVCHCPMNNVSTRGADMKSEYDLSKMKKRRNPYATRLKKQVTIRMGTDIIDYFKTMAEQTGIPYQNLINLYLRDCVENERKFSLEWAS
jgi:uncharacterized DUF497 family protein